MEALKTATHKPLKELSRKQLKALYGGFVRRIALKYVDKCPEDLEDLEQFGWIGLSIADSRYNPDEGIPFKAFAVRFVKGEMLHHLRDHWGAMAKVPRKALELKQEFDAMTRSLSKKGLNRDEAWITQGLAIAPSRWEFIVEATARRPLLEANEELCGESIGIVEDEDHKLILQAIIKLPNPYRDVIHCHYYQDMPLRQIAADRSASIADVEEWLAIAVERIKVAVTRAKEF